jgi:hypothetical protein
VWGNGREAGVRVELGARVLQVWGMRSSPIFALFCCGILLGGGLATGCRTLKGKGADQAGSESKPIPMAASNVDWNQALIAAIERMPIGGGYSGGADAKASLQTAVAWEEGKPALRPREAQPSFCSGATYLLLLVTLAQEQRAGHLSLSPGVWRALMVEGQEDGVGVWGRWNANGPAVARLFSELGVGRSFTDWKEAKPGDFLKLFWNESIGASEKGHLVLYIDRSVVEGEDTVTFWSSNDPGGYGLKQVPMSQIKRSVFSRLEHPERFSRVTSLSERDSFLSDLLNKNVSPKQAESASGFKGW